MSVFPTGNVCLEIRVEFVPQPLPRHPYRKSSFPIEMPRLHPRPLPQEQRQKWNVFFASIKPTNKRKRKKKHAAHSCVRAFATRGQREPHEADQLRKMQRVGVTLISIDLVVRSLKGKQYTPVTIICLHVLLHRLCPNCFNSNAVTIC